MIQEKNKSTDSKIDYQSKLWVIASNLRKTPIFNFVIIVSCLDGHDVLLQKKFQLQQILEKAGKVEGEILEETESGHR